MQQISLAKQWLVWAKSAKSADFAQIVAVWQEYACVVICGAMERGSGIAKVCLHCNAWYALRWHCGKGVLDCVALHKFLAYNFLVLQSLL